MPDTPTNVTVWPGIRRSFPTGPNTYITARIGERLKVWVDLPDAPPETQVRLLSDMLPNGALALQRQSGLRFQTSVEVQPGRYTFRLAIRRTKESWGYDAADPVRLLVRRPLPTCRMYSLLPTASGTISQWRDRLPDLQALGFDTVHVLPVTTMCQSKSPYSAHDLFHVEPRYADPAINRSADEQFGAFVEDLRNRKMRLCVDLVFNHVGVQSQLVREHPGWMLTDDQEADGLRRAGWSDGTNWHKWTDLVKLNYQTPVESDRAAIFETMNAYGMHWAEIAASTGGMIRLDNLHSSDPAFISQFLAALHARFPDLAVLAEMFAMPDEIRRLCWSYGVDLLLATPWEHPFVPRLRDYLRHMHEVAATIQHHIPLTSHDAGSPCQEFGAAHASIPRYLVSALCGFGCTGITQGTEYGAKERPSFIGFRAPTKAPLDRTICLAIHEMNQLVASCPALSQPGNLRFVDAGHDAILGAWRAGSQGEASFLLLANFDIHHPQEIRLDDPALSETGYLPNGKTCKLNQPIRLAPCGVLIVADRPIHIDVPGLLLASQ